MASLSLCFALCCVCFSMAVAKRNLEEEDVQISLHSHMNHMQMHLSGSLMNSSMAQPLDSETSQCPEFITDAGDCTFQIRRQKWEKEAESGNWTAVGYENAFCHGDAALLKRLGLTTPIGLDVNGPWAAMLMDETKTIETRRYPLRIFNMPIAMLDTRTFPALVTALERERSDQACILGQLQFERSIRYPDNEQGNDAFRADFELDPDTLAFGGHRVPCDLHTYATAFGSSEMYGWHVEPGSVRKLDAGDIDAHPSRDVVNAIGRWGQSKKDLCFMPSSDGKKLKDRNARSYSSSPIDTYTDQYHCLEMPAEIDGSLRCLGTVEITPAN